MQFNKGFTDYGVAYTAAADMTWKDTTNVLIPADDIIKVQTTSQSMSLNT